MDQQTDDIATRLRRLDAGAPLATDAALHRRVLERLRLEDDVPAPTPVAPRRRHVRRAAVLVAAAAAGVTALTLVQPAPPAMAALTPEALATWTPTAQPVGDTTVERSSCLREFGDGIADDPDARYLLEERRGVLTSMIASYGDQTAFCIVGPDNTGLLNSMSGLDVDVTDRPGSGVTSAVSGDDLDGPVGTRLHYVTGRYADDVQGVELVLSDGRQVVASTQDGWFTAWWTGAAATPDAELTWTTADGTATTSAYADLPS